MKALAGVLAVVVVLLLAVAFQWRYDQITEQTFDGTRVVMVRTNRFSGEMQRLSETYGWVSAKTAASNVGSVPCTDAEKKNRYASLICR